MLPRFALVAIAAALAGCSNRGVEGRAGAPAASIEAKPVPVEEQEELRPPAPPVRRTQIGVPENNPLELYPPRSQASASPLVVALHGKDMDPIELCDRWNDEGRERSWLVCPAGNAPGAESFDWGG